MKKILLTTSGLVVLATAFAQIIITQSNMPYSGLGIITANDTLSPIAPGSGGTNQTWNFAPMLNQWQDTMTFTNPNWIPGASNFPSSNLGIVQTDTSGSPSYVFCSSSSTAFDVDGFYADVTGSGYLPIAFQSAWRMLQLPATYQTTWNTTQIFSLAFPYTQQPPVDSARIKEKVYITDLIDGWGTITTPSGSYNSIRQFQRDSTIDSIFVHIPPPGPGWIFAQKSQSVDSTYRWWTNTVNFTIAEFSSNGQGGWDHNYFLSTFTGINEHSTSSELSIYPNPSRGEFQIQLVAPWRQQLASSQKQEASIEIYNVLGEKVAPSNSLPFGKGGGWAFDLSSQPNGMYFLLMKSEEGTAVEKLIISR